MNPRIRLGLLTVALVLAAVALDSLATQVFVRPRRPLTEAEKLELLVSRSESIVTATSLRIGDGLPPGLPHAEKYGDDEGRSYLIVEPVDWLKGPGGSEPIYVFIARQFAPMWKRRSDGLKGQSMVLFSGDGYYARYWTPWSLDVRDVPLARMLTPAFKDSLRAELDHQSLDSLIVRSAVIALGEVSSTSIFGRRKVVDGRIVATELPMRRRSMPCVIEGDSTRCPELSVEQVLCGALPSDKVPIYSLMNHGIIWKDVRKIYFLETKPDGAYQVLSFHAGIAPNKRGVSASEEYIEQIVRRIEALR